MAKLTLRPYQQECVDAVFKSKVNQNLISLPTGCGKTIIFSEIARQYGKKCLILAHRDELIQQAYEKVQWVWDTASIGIIKAEIHEPDNDVVVASVQSMNQRRLDRLGKSDFGLVITDEAHHAAAVSYKRVYDWVGCLPKQNEVILHVGVTATPNRTDKKLLGDIFTNIAYEGDILDFIPNYLSDLQIIRRESGIILDGISRSANDLNCHELSDALNTPEGNKMVVDAYKEVASDCKSTIAFCADIAHIHGLTQEFIDNGIKACGIDSTMKLETRRKILKQFYDGHIQVLVNCGILTEGFDCPQVDCILLVRPTRSELLLRQMIGRGTRLYPGKEKCKVVDIACVSSEWDLVDPTQLFGFAVTMKENETVSETRESDRRYKKQYGEVKFSDQIAGIYDTRSPGQLDWQKLRWKGWLLRCGKDGNIKIMHIRNSLKDDERYMAYHRKEWVDDKERKCYEENRILDDATLDQAFSFAESYARENEFDMGLALPNRKWHKDKATEAQLKYIKGLGGSEHITENMTKREASNLISWLKDSDDRRSY